MSAKRSDYISWDEYFMGVAHLSGMRSKDPNTQVGACIVSPDNKILSMGYNEMCIRDRSYTTVRIPAWIMAFAHSLQGKRETYSFVPSREPPR